MLVVRRLRYSRRCGCLASHARSEPARSWLVGAGSARGVDMTEWSTFGARRPHEDGWRYDRFGPERLLRMVEAGADVVPVRLIEDGEGPLFGWLRTGADVPEMIRRRQAEFEMQFPYGYESEERRGKGRMIRLRVGEA